MSREDYYDALSEIPINHMLEYIAATYYERYQTDPRRLMESDAAAYTSDGAYRTNRYIDRLEVDLHDKNNDNKNEQT